MFQTIQPGETVTADVNAAKSYQLEGITTAQVTAVQGFKYVIGPTAPSALNEMTDCADVTSGTAVITPDQSTVAS
jgi:deuterolysin